MTGYTPLTNNTYVAAYQAELRADLRNAGTSDRKLVALHRLAERLLARTGTFSATRRVAPADPAR